MENILQELSKVLQGIGNTLKQFGRVLLGHLFIGISETKKGVPVKIYDTLNNKIKEMEQVGIKPILVLGDDTDSYLSCYLFNLLRKYDGLNPITMGGVLVYRGKDKGMYLDTTLYKGGIGLVLLDTDIVFPNNSISLSNHVNLMDDTRIININNYLGCNSLESYKGKYPLGTTQILLSVCKVKGIEIPKDLYNYFLRCDMSRLPKKVFMSNVIYHFKVLGLDKEFKQHLKEVKRDKVKGDYKLFTDVYVENGTICIDNMKYPVVKKLKDFNSPHLDVRLSNLRKVYDLDTVRMNVKDDGVLVGSVEGGTFTVYTHRNKYYYTRVISV